MTTHNDIQKVVHKETNNRQELEDTVQFEQLLRDRIHRLILTPDFNHNRKKASSLRNEKNTLECVLGHLSTLKYDELPSSPSEMMEVNRAFVHAKN